MRQAPPERPTHLQGVLYRSKRNQSAIFVDPRDEECQGDGANTRIGEEVERKNERKNGDVHPRTPTTMPSKSRHMQFLQKGRAHWKDLSDKTAVARGKPVGLIQGDELFDEEDTLSDDVGSQAAATSVGFVKREHHNWTSESSDDYMVMAIRRKKETLLKVAGTKLKIYINGHPMNIWIDSGSPISILSLDDLKRTVGRAGITLKQEDIEDDEFRDYSNNGSRCWEELSLS